MFAAFKKHWKELKSSRPGHRFQDRYERRKKEHRGSFHWARWLNIGGGILLTLAGIVLLAAPGPGLLVSVVGLSMLGSEFLTLARFLDWSEVKLRKTFQWCRSWWRHSGLVARASVIVLGCLLVGGGAYGGYVFFMKA